MSDTTGMVTITIERGGEKTTTEVPEGSTIGALIKDGHLHGVSVDSARVNGAKACADTPVNPQDTVSSIPKSGKQG